MKEDPALRQTTCMLCSIMPGSLRRFTGITFRGNNTVRCLKLCCYDPRDTSKPGKGTAKRTVTCSGVKMKRSADRTYAVRKQRLPVRPEPAHCNTFPGGFSGVLQPLFSAEAFSQTHKHPGFCKCGRNLN